jgi:hypothetical protein
VRESAVENYLKTGVEAKGGECAKLVDEGRRGFPDRTVLMPGAQIIFIETKTLGGKLESWQRRRIDRLCKLGFRVEILWDCIQVDKFLDTL